MLVRPAKKFWNTQQPGGKVAFTPASLGPALWIEPAKGGLFQSNAGTTAATANSDVVGFCPDWSGNSFTLTSAANDTTRPTLQGVGTNPNLSFDGSNDVLLNASSLGMYAAGAISIFAAVSANPAASAYLLAEASTTAAIQIYGLNANSATPSTMNMFVRNDGNTALVNNSPSLTGAFPNSAKVVGMIDSGSVISEYLDQGAAVTQSYTRSGTLTMNRFSLGALVRNTTGSWFAASVYGLVIVKRVLTSGEQAALVTYLGALQGRTI